MIKFADTHTLIPTPEVEAFIARHLDPEWMRFWYDPGHGPEIGATAPLIPSMNWQKTFRPRINSLIWPTGASRWASMLLLVDSQMLTSIMSVVNVPVSAEYRASPAQLVIADSGFVSEVDADGFTREELTPAEGEEPAVKGNRVALSTEMYALEARPVSLPYEYKINTETEEYEWTETTEKTLWILPIVDERWFEQWNDVTSSAEWEEWSDGIRNLTLTGTIDVDEVHSAYGVPPGDASLSFITANAAVAVDALCHNIGHRCIRRIDGTMSTNTATSAATAWDNNFTGDGDDQFSVWQRVAGGDYTDKHKAAATIPEQIRVVFSEESGYLITAEDAGATQWGISGTKHTIHAYSSGTEGQEDFALQAAKDYIKWMARKADVTFAGVKAWRITGFEDVVIWSVSLEGGVSTRIVTHPENVALLPIGGGSEGCIRSYDLRLLWDPEEAALWIDVKFHDVTERIDIGREDDETDVMTAVDAHTEFVAADVHCTAESAGGFPHSNILVTLPAGATIVDHGGTITDRAGNPMAEFRVDICNCAGS